jgi:hypothetical protein
MTESTIGDPPREGHSGGAVVNELVGWRGSGEKTVKTWVSVWAVTVKDKAAEGVVAGGRGIIDDGGGAIKGSCKALQIGVSLFSGSLQLMKRTQ